MTKFHSVVVDSIPHNSTEGIIKTILEEVVAVDTNSLFGKTARSPEGNVDVEPPSSEDNSAMIMIEIGVDVDEGPRPNIMIVVGHSPRSSQGDQSRWRRRRRRRRRAIDLLLITQRNSQ